MGLFQYADDSSLCFLANRKHYGTTMDVNKTDLGAAVESFAQQASHIGLELHPSKTELVIVNGRDRAVPDVKFNFRGVEVTPTNKMRLLGFQVNREFGEFSNGASLFEGSKLSRMREKFGSFYG